MKIEKIFRTTLSGAAFAAFAAVSAFAPSVFAADSPSIEGVRDAQIAKIAARLCRNNGGDWTGCVEFSVANRSKVDWNDKIVAVPISGTPENPVDGALSVVGERAEALRFCDATGAEFLFNVVDSAGKAIARGVVDDGATLTIPANVAAGETGRYFLFFRNDAAFPLPDRLEKTLKSAGNLDFETGANGEPDGWRFDAADADRSLTWSDERPFSGEKCVRCDVATGAEPSWIAARQGGIAVEPSAKYRFSARVRAENLVGSAGWYLHFGNEKNGMITSPIFAVSDKAAFDWTLVSGEVAVPADADRVEFGTVLRGTGTAWFDAVSFERIGGAAASDREIVVEKPFEISVPSTVYPGSAGSGADSPLGAAAFEPEKIGIDPNARIALIRIDAPNSGGERLIRLDLRSFAVRWGRVLNPGDFEILDLRGRSVPVEYFDDALFFSAEVVPNARNCFAVVEKRAQNASANENVDFDLNIRLDAGTSAQKKDAPRAVANQAFPGTSLQGTNVENAAESADFVDEKSLVLPKFIAERNLVSDGDFETFDPATGLPKSDADGSDGGWSRNANAPGLDFSVVDPGVAALGKRALQTTVEPGAKADWVGWRRRVDLEPNRTYSFGFAVSTEAEGGSFDLHYHQRRADGTLAGGGMGSLGNPASGKTPWTLRCGSLRTSSDAASISFQLTTTSVGTVRYDSFFVAPIDVATPVAFLGGRNGAFQVPAVAKVFADTTFAADEREVDETAPATCALALGEEETLQFALRSENDKIVRVVASVPTLATDSSVSLEKPEIFAVGRVIIDWPSRYFNDREGATRRKFPSGAGASDGWIGYWPDPLIPIRERDRATADDAAKFDRSLVNDSQILADDGAKGLLRLTADETRAVWLRFKTTSETVPGVYRGALTLRDADGTERVLPYSVEVLAFDAPETKITGIYDARIRSDYFGEGSYSEKIDKIAAKLFDRKLNSDSVPVSPTIRYDKTTGIATADWTAFDAAATKYFDERGGKAAYATGDFYLFGWGNPPKVVEGEAPFEGEYPYPDADRATLRPEYKKAYQAKLKLFWEHLQERGWADKFVLYISDEPFYSRPEIIAQMKALCDMIHEVDATIPIYCSTWVLVPEWLGYLDVWGVGHYGGVSENQLQQIRDAGGRIWWTTDGQMCLDTPLCATERLLPYACAARGAELYEFWGASWHTCNPFDFGSHLYIPQSDSPGVHYYVRYPSGDGYIFYPGDLVGLKGEILDSIRSEQAREGIEDAGWLDGLRRAISEKTVPNSPERAEAEAALDAALEFLPLHCGSGWLSTRYMPDPKEFERIRLDVGKALEKLSTK